MINVIYQPISITTVCEDPGSKIGNKLDGYTLPSMVTLVTPLLDPFLFITLI
jgi:hypothetical protein